MFSCTLCEINSVYTASLCEECRKIKHMMTCYTPERVIEVLDRVLMRTPSKQELKIDVELKTEKVQIEKKIITRSRVEKLDRADLMKGC